MDKAIKLLGKRWQLKIAGTILILLFPVLVRGSLSADYLVLLGCFIMVYVLAASGLDILFGYCGQISLGHAGFFAIGAYGTSIMDKTLGLPQVVSVLLACLLAVIVAAVIAFPATKLRFHFLSLATIAFGEIIYAFISASPGGITGNFVGFFPRKLVIFGVTLDSYTKFFYFAFVMAVLALVIKQNLIASKTGRALIAIRENVVASGGMGINVRKYKMIAFCTSACYVALSGALYAYLMGYINPSTFMFDQSVMFLTMLLFGGSGTLWGPVLGVISVQLINEALRSFEQYQTMFYGVFLLAVILFMPSGLINLRIRRKKNKEVSENAES